MMLRLLPIVLAIAWSGGIANAGAAASPGADGPFARARLVSEHMNLTPGKRSWLALHFEIEPDWHMYWKGQNDSGMPPTLELTLPAGYKAGEILWPAPERHVESGEMLNYVLHERLTLLIPIDVPVTARVGADATIGVATEWLVCKEACVLEEAELSVTLPVRDTTPAAEADPKQAALFAAARERLPRTPPKDKSPFKIEWNGARVTIDAPGAAELAFSPDEDGVTVESPLADAAAKGPKLAFSIKPPRKPDQKLAGVLEIRREGKKPEHYNVSLTQPGPVRPG